MSSQSMLAPFFHRGRPIPPDADPAGTARGSRTDRQLRYFAEDVGLIVALEQGGKLSMAEAFRRIERRYRLLARLVTDLEDGRNPLPQ